MEGEYEELKEGLAEAVNGDEVVGYIMRRAKEEYNKDLLYSDVRAVLVMEQEYFRTQCVVGIAAFPEEA